MGPPGVVRRQHHALRQYAAYVEAFFRTRDPGTPVEFVIVGLPSETVSGLSEDGHAGGEFPRPDLHERLGRVLAKVRPDLVFACYGMNDGIYLPPDEGRSRKFAGGIERLRERVAAAGVRLVHLTPPPYDGTRVPAAGSDAAASYDRVLAGYAEWLLGRRADGWDVCDLHGPMSRYLAERRQRDPAFALAGDGVHPGDLGHWLMARQVLLHLGAADLAADAEDAADGDDAAARAAMLPTHANATRVLALVRERQALMRDAWLTATEHQRPGIAAGLPLDEAHAKAAEVDKLLKRELDGG